MSLLPAVLQALVVILFVMGSASVMIMLAGCLNLRVMARNSTRYDDNLILNSPLVPGVSILIALPDASPDSRAFVNRALELQFGKREIVLVLDGPDDAQMDQWIQEFGLSLSGRRASQELPSSAIREIYEARGPVPLVVVNKDPAAEDDVFHAGVNVAAFPIVAFLDPLSQFDSRILLNLIRPMLEEPDHTLGVCGFMPAAQDAGMAQERSAANSWLGRFGELEALRMWLGRCAAFSKWKRLVPVPGASMLVWREAIIKAGAFSGGPLDLFLNLHRQAKARRQPYQLAFVPEGASLARIPASLGDLRRRATADTAQIGAAFRHGNASAIGWAMPALFSIQWLRPLLETAAWCLLLVGLLSRQVDFALAGVVVLATAGLGMLTSMAAVVFRELVKSTGSDPGELTALFLTAIPENLGYRQLRNLWLIAGLLRSAK